MKGRQLKYEMPTQFFYGFLAGSPEKRHRAIYDWFRKRDLPTASGRVNGQFSRDEFARLNRRDQRQAIAYFKEIAPQYGKVNVRESRAYRKLRGTQRLIDDPTDERTFTAAGTYASEANLIEPIYSTTVARVTNRRAGERVIRKEQTFNHRVSTMIRDAETFVAVRAYGMERLSLAEELIAAAEAGKRVFVELNPLEDAFNPESQGAFQGALEEAKRKNPELPLFVYETDLVELPQYEQIQHDKQVITDTKWGMLAELGGGINQGKNSTNNWDLSDYVEGVAALDALQFFARGVPSSLEAEFRSLAVPTYRDTVVAVEDKHELITSGELKSSLQLAEVEVGGAGRYQARRPLTYRAHNPGELAALVQRAQSGRRIDITSESLLLDGGVVPPTRTKEELLSALGAAKGGDEFQCYFSSLFDRDEFISLKHVDAEVVAGVKNALARGVRVSMTLPVGTGSRKQEEWLSYPALSGIASEISVKTPRLDSAVLKILATAVEHTSEVNVVYPAGLNLADRTSWNSKIKNFSAGRNEHGDGKKRTYKPLKPLSVRGADYVSTDVSYQRMVLRELDEAIRKRESIEIGSFALTDSIVREKLVEAAHAGCEVVALVHDLDIDERLINQGMVFQLAQHGIDVRVFNAERMGELLGDLATPNVKLHHKLCVLGRRRQGSGRLEPRMFNGSSNFSRMGFTTNIESGRLIRGAEIVETVASILIDPVRDAAVSVPKVSFSRPEKRVAPTEWAKSSDRYDEVMYVVLDIESDGFSAHMDDHIASFSMLGLTLDKTGELTFVEGGEKNFYCKLPADYLGRTRSMNGGAFSVHGIAYDQDNGDVYQYFREEESGRALAKHAVPLEEGDPTGDPADPFTKKIRILTGDEIASGKFPEEQAALGEALPSAELPKRIYQTLQELHQETGRRVVLVAHNGKKFDMPFINSSFGRDDMKVTTVAGTKNVSFDGTVIDSLMLAKDVIRPDEVGGNNYDLDTLSQYYNIGGPRGTHTAKEDTLKNSHIFAALMRTALERKPAQGKPAETIFDFLNEDTLKWDKGKYPRFVMRAGGKKVEARISVGGNDDLRLELPKGDGEWDRGAKIDQFDILEVDADLNFRVRLTGGSGSSQVEYEGEIPYADLKFFRAGKFFHKLRDELALYGTEVFPEQMYREFALEGGVSNIPKS